MGRKAKQILAGVKGAQETAGGLVTLPAGSLPGPFQKMYDDMLTGAEKVVTDPKNPTKELDRDTYLTVLAHYVQQAREAEAQVRRAGAKYEPQIMNTYARNAYNSVGALVHQMDQQHTRKIHGSRYPVGHTQGPAHAAMKKLSNEVNGYGGIKGLTSGFMDWKAYEKDGVLKGIKWQGLAAGAAGFFLLPKVFGMGGGIMSWVVGALGAVGAAYAMEVGKNLFFKKEPDPVPAGVGPVKAVSADAPGQTRVQGASVDKAQAAARGGLSGIGGGEEASIADNKQPGTSKAVRQEANLGMKREQGGVYGAL